MKHSFGLIKPLACIRETLGLDFGRNKSYSDRGFKWSYSTTVLLLYWCRGCSMYQDMLLCVGTVVIPGVI